MLLGLLVPQEFSTDDGVSKGEEVRENVGVNSAAGRESAGRMGTGALVREDPEVKLREEASKVGEGGVGRGREGLNPEGRADLDWVLLEKGVRVLDLETLVLVRELRRRWWRVVGGEGGRGARGRHMFEEEVAVAMAVEVFDGSPQ